MCTSIFVTYGGGWVHQNDHGWLELCQGVFPKMSEDFGEVN